MIGTPSRLRLIRKSAALARIFPTLEHRKAARRFFLFRSNFLYLGKSNFLFFFSNKFLVFFLKKGQKLLGTGKRSQ